MRMWLACGLGVPLPAAAYLHLLQTRFSLGLKWVCRMFCAARAALYWHQQKTIGTATIWVSASATTLCLSSP